MAKKNFPTPEMLKAREKWAQKTEEEKQAFHDAFRTELKNYYESRFPLEVRKILEGRDE